MCRCERPRAARRRWRAGSGCWHHTHTSTLATRIVTAGARAVRAACVNAGHPGATPTPTPRTVGEQCALVGGGTRRTFTCSDGPPAAAAATAGSEAELRAHGERTYPARTRGALWRASWASAHPSWQTATAGRSRGGPRTPHSPPADCTRRVPRARLTTPRSCTTRALARRSAPPPPPKACARAATPAVRPGAGGDGAPTRSVSVARARVSSRGRRQPPPPPPSPRQLSRASGALRALPPSSSAHSPPLGAASLRSCAPWPSGASRALHCGELSGAAGARCCCHGSAAARVLFSASAPPLPTLQAMAPPAWKETCWPRRGARHGGAFPAGPRRSPSRAAVQQSRVANPLTALCL